MTALPLRASMVALIVFGAACASPSEPTRQSAGQALTTTIPLVLTTTSTSAAPMSTAPANTTTPATTAPPVATATVPAVVIPPTTVGLVATTAPPTGPVPHWTESLLSQLVVSEAPPPVSYDRDHWGPGWVDTDGDCLSTRHEVLMLESASSVFLNDSGCLIAGGSWFGAFTGTWFTDPSDLDIDHFVPLANAHRSGGWAWGADTKQRYYNDLSDPSHLIAVSASANRSKGSRGPEDWRPPDSSYWCTYADTWADIKIRWSLTVTATELVALEDMLATCSSEPTVLNETPAVIDLGPPIDLGEPVELGPTTSTSTIPSETSQPANPGNAMNCSDFATYQQALAWYETYAPWYGDVSRLDGDGDGEPCESLPGGP